jgi:aminomethyltransferase
MSELNTDQSILKLPLDAIHGRLGGRLASFGGWRMPMHYAAGIIHEHHHTRQEASLFDCTHMGEFRVSGEHAGRDLDRLLPRRVTNQKDWACRYNFLLTEKGTIVDDLIVYKQSDNEFFIVVNAATTAADAAHFQSHLSSETCFINESETWGKFDLQGPKAAQVLQTCGLPIDSLPSYYHFTCLDILGVPCLVSRTGYTGELGYEIYHPISDTIDLWQGLIRVSPVQPAGLGARDTLRLEMGYPLYGHELNREITPVEAGWGELIDFDHEFMGRDCLRGKPMKILVGIQFSGRRAARAGTKLTSNTGKTVGEVTSGSFSPSLQSAIALGYVSADTSVNDTEVHAAAGRETLTGRIQSLPFYRNGTVRSKI